MHACLFAQCYHSDRESLWRREEIARLLAKQHDTSHSHMHTHTHTHPWWLSHLFCVDCCLFLPRDRVKITQENKRKGKERKMMNPQRHRCFWMLELRYMQECLSLNWKRNITHLVSLIFGLTNKINKMGKKTFEVKLKLQQHLSIW